MAARCPRNRSSEARHQRAVYSRDQALRAVENLAQLVQVDVRSAYIEVNRAQEQVAATAATRRLQEETLRVETEKFRVGRSTSLLVAQAQRDLLESQIGEVAAVVAHLKALTQLHLQQGALLERRGIAAPGATPVDLSAPRGALPAFRTLEKTFAPGLDESAMRVIMFTRTSGACPDGLINKTHSTGGPCGCPLSCADGRCPGDHLAEAICARGILAAAFWKRVRTAA